MVIILCLVFVVLGMQPRVIAYSPSNTMRVAVYPAPHGKTSAVYVEGISVLFVHNGKYFLQNTPAQKKYIVNIDDLVFYSGGDIVEYEGFNLYYGVDR